VEDFRYLFLTSVPSLRLGLNNPGNINREGSVKLGSLFPLFAYPWRQWIRIPSSKRWKRSFTTTTPIPNPIPIPTTTTPIGRRSRPPDPTFTASSAGNSPYIRSSAVENVICIHFLFHFSLLSSSLLVSHLLHVLCDPWHAMENSDFESRLWFNAGIRRMHNDVVFLLMAVFW